MVHHSRPATAPQLDAIFLALSDTTRRAIVGRLAEGEASMTALAEPFDMSLTAVIKHVRVLKRAGLVDDSKVGRERRCRLVAKPLSTADEWLTRYSGFWQSQLTSLSRHVAAQRAGQDE